MTTTSKPTIITDRKEMAQALNFGKYKVLKYDLSETEEFLAGVEYESRNHGRMTSIGKLRSGYQTKDDSVLYIAKSGTMISAHVDVHDWIECADKANAPLLTVGETVAVLYYSKEGNTAFVRLVKVESINVGSSSLVMFGDL